MTIRIRLKWLAILFLVAIVVTLFPFLYLMGFGLANGLDVSSAVKHSITGDPVGVATIPPANVPFLTAPVRWTGLIENQELNECSGMAWSDRDLVWAHNDSGGKTRLYALKADGTDLGYVDINLPQMGDWEDMARFTMDGESYLVIADVGDNYRWRPQLYLIVVKEPDDETLRQRKTIEPAWTIVFRYPEGYRDSEGVGVDPEGGWVYLVSKRTIPAEMYRVPLQTKQPMSIESAPLIAEKVAILNGIPQPDELDLLQDPEWGATRSRPTAMSMQSNRAVVVTYKDAYLYQRRNDEPWADVFSGVPGRIELPRAFGREAATLSTDGKFLLVGAERQGNDASNLYQVALP